MKVITRQHVKHSVLLIVVNLFICFLFVLPTFCDEKFEWKESSNKKGVKVEIRAVKGCPLNECRAEAIIDAPIEVVYQIIADPDTWINWYGFCAASKTVAKIDENTLVIYLVGDVPYPFYDRDGCLLVKLEKNFEEGTGFWAANLIPHSECDQYGMDVVTKENRRRRMKKSYGSYKLNRVDSDKTKVVYQAGGDPGVFLPYWLLNFFVTLQPVHTIKGLRKEVKKEVYYEKVGILYNEKLVGK
jgi:hypothetical protein